LTAWRALLGAALLGTATRAAVAAPTSPCDTGKQDFCGRGLNNCCPGKCFVVNEAGDCPVCCIEPDYVICAGKTIAATTDATIREPTCCKARDERGGPISDPCGKCEQPTPPAGSEFCPSVITGSYRRR
jgi:hypothetical protein